MKGRIFISLILSQIFLTSCTSAGNIPADSTIYTTEFVQNSIDVTCSEVVIKENTTNTDFETSYTSSLIVHTETLYDNSMQSNYTDLCREFVHREEVNGISIGSEFTKVIEILGKPYEKYEPFTSDDGELQTYLFDNGHIRITFVKVNDLITVNNYSFDVDTNAITTSGVCIGDSRQKIIDVYGDLISVDESVWFCSDDYSNYNITKDTINTIPLLMVGSFYHGYMSFKFDDNDNLIAISAGDISSM